MVPELCSAGRGFQPKRLAANITIFTMKKAPAAKAAQLQGFVSSLNLSERAPSLGQTAMHLPQLTHCGESRDFVPETQIAMGQFLSQRRQFTHLSASLVTVKSRASDMAPYLAPSGQR